MLDFVLQAVTISRLLELAPPGTIDPSPYVYDSTMFTMAGLMGVAAVAHGLVRPVHPKYFEGSPTTVIDVTPPSSLKSIDEEQHRPLIENKRQ